MTDIHKRKFYYQVIRHVPQEDGSILEVHTPDIFNNISDAQRLCNEDKTGLFTCLDIERTILKIDEEELQRYLMRNVK